nr:hypothetical protein [Streptomyces globosus]
MSGPLRGVVPGALGGRRVLKAVRRLPVPARRKVAQRPLLPKEIDAELVPPTWKKAACPKTELPEGAVASDAYVVCVLGSWGSCTAH